MMFSNGQRPIALKPAMAVFALQAEQAGFTEREDRYGGATWRGVIDGQPVVMTLDMRTRMRYRGEVRQRVVTGFRIMLEALCPTGARLVVAPRDQVGRFARWLNRKGGLLPCRMEHATLVAWAHEPAWAERVLSEPAVRTLMPSLQHADGTSWHGAVHVQADKVGLMANGNIQALGENLRPWSRSVAALASALAALPGPAAPHQPGWMERRPGCFIALVVLLVLLVSFAFTAALITIIWLISR